MCPKLTCARFECQPEFFRPSRDIIARGESSDGSRSGRDTDDVAAEIDIGDLVNVGGGGTQQFADENTTEKTRPAAEEAAVLHGDSSYWPHKHYRPTVIARCPCDCVMHDDIDGAVCDCSETSPFDFKNRCDMRRWFCVPETYIPASGIYSSCI